MSPGSLPSYIPILYYLVSLERKHTETIPPFSLPIHPLPSPDRIGIWRIQGEKTRIIHYSDGLLLLFTLYCIMKTYILIYYYHLPTVLALYTIVAEWMPLVGSLCSSIAFTLPGLVLPWSLFWEDVCAILLASSFCAYSSPHIPPFPYVPMDASPSLPHMQLCVCSCTAFLYFPITFIIAIPALYRRSGSWFCGVTMLPLPSHFVHGSPGPIVLICPTSLPSFTYAPSLPSSYLTICSAPTTFCVIPTLAPIYLLGCAVPLTFFCLLPPTLPICNVILTYTYLCLPLHTCQTLPVPSLPFFPPTTPYPSMGLQFLFFLGLEFCPVCLTAHMCVALCPAASPGLGLPPPFATCPPALPQQTSPTYLCHTHAFLPSCPLATHHPLPIQPSPVTPLRYHLPSCLVCGWGTCLASCLPSAAPPGGCLPFTHLPCPIPSLLIYHPMPHLLCLITPFVFLPVLPPCPVVIILLPAFLFPCILPLPLAFLLHFSLPSSSFPSHQPCSPVEDGDGPGWDDATPSPHWDSAPALYHLGTHVLMPHVQCPTHAFPLPPPRFPLPLCPLDALPTSAILLYPSCPRLCLPFTCLPCPLPLLLPCICIYPLSPWDLPYVYAILFVACLGSLLPSPPPLPAMPSHSPCFFFCMPALLLAFPFPWFLFPTIATTVPHFLVSLGFSSCLPCHLCLWVYLPLLYVVPLPDLGWLCLYTCACLVPLPVGITLLP